MSLPHIVEDTYGSEIWNWL